MLQLESSLSFQPEAPRASMGVAMTLCPDAPPPGLFSHHVLVGVTGPPQGADLDPERSALGFSPILPRGLDLFNPYPQVWG